METESRTFLAHVRNVLSAEWTTNAQDPNVLQFEGFAATINMRHLQSICAAMLAEPESELTVLTEEIALCYGGFSEHFPRLFGRRGPWEEFRHISERERRQFYEYCETNGSSLFDKMRDYNRAFTTLLAALERYFISWQS